MATVKLFLYTSDVTKSGCPIKLRFSANSERADVLLNVYVQPENWDKDTQMILSSEPKFRVKNKIIQERLYAAKEYLREQLRQGRDIKDAKKLRADFLIGRKSEMFFEYMQKILDNKEGKTKKVYTSTMTRLKLFANGNLYFDDITPSWLTKFDKWCKACGNKTSTRGDHMRNIRAIFDMAIADQIISVDLYPFMAFKNEKEEIAKRALTIEEFRKILNFSGDAHENWAKDVFLLSFYLIGINMKDLFNLDGIENNEIKYRQKNTNKFFYVNLEPEAIELINRYRGNILLLNFNESIMRHESFTKKVNEYLIKVVTKINKQEEKKGSEIRIKEFATNAARHSWATFAAELKIHNKTISRALGHKVIDGSSLPTEINIQHYDIKVKNANRKIIDYVFGVS